MSKAKAGYIACLLPGLFLLSACFNFRAHHGHIPPGVTKKILEFSETVCEKGEVRRYRFQGKEVYLFDASGCCCDQTSDITDEKGNVICSLGGIAGNMNCNGQNFYENAAKQELIWSKIPGEKKQEQEK